MGSTTLIQPPALEEAARDPQPDLIDAEQAAMAIYNSAWQDAEKALSESMVIICRQVAAMPQVAAMTGPDALRYLADKLVAFRSRA